MNNQCAPPKGTKPDTNHTLDNPDGGTTWAHWNGKSWDGLAWDYGDAPLSERIATTPEYAYSLGYRYEFAHSGQLQVRREDK
jgi:hypothetical protein